MCNEYMHEGIINFTIEIVEFPSVLNNYVLILCQQFIVQPHSLCDQRTCYFYLRKYLTNIPYLANIHLTVTFCLKLYSLTPSISSLHFLLQTYLLHQL